VTEPTTPAGAGGQNPVEARDEATRPNGAADGDTAAPPTQQELATLQARAAERDQFLDLARRTQAEFENYQRRNQRIMQEDRQRAVAGVMRDMLTVLDNLQRALAAAQQAGEGGALVQGVSMVQSQFLDVLRRHGVKPIEALGKPFDHHLHEAVTQVPAPDRPPGTVVQVLEQGFLIDDRVLRPAKVVVSA
jgi:molecular chaperone GrpE